MRNASRFSFRYCWRINQLVSNHRCDDKITNFRLGRPRNRDDVVALSKQPRKHNLARRRIVLLADPLQVVDNLEDVREVFLRVAGYNSAEVALLEVVRRFLRIKFIRTKALTDKYNKVNSRIDR